MNTLLPSPLSPYLVDEHDGRRRRGRGGKEVPNFGLGLARHAGDDLRRRHPQKRDPHLGRHRVRERRLPTPRWPVQEHAAGGGDAEPGVDLGVLEGVLHSFPDGGEHGVDAAQIGVPGAARGGDEGGRRAARALGRARRRGRRAARALGRRRRPRRRRRRPRRGRRRGAGGVRGEEGGVDAAGRGDGRRARERGGGRGVGARVDVRPVARAHRLVGRAGAAGAGRGGGRRGAAGSTRATTSTPTRQRRAQRSRDHHLERPRRAAPVLGVRVPQRGGDRVGAAASERGLGLKRWGAWSVFDGCAGPY
jgi:hypothetical protein